MPKTHLNDLFDQLEPEKGNKLDDKIDVEYRPDVEELIRTILEVDEKIYDSLTPDNLFDYFNTLNPNKYSNEIITYFSLALNDNLLKKSVLYEQTGTFLSYLIYNSADNDQLILTSHLDTKLNSLGYKNSKNVSVQGNVGNGVGAHMEAGEIKILGNCGMFAGYKMNGGKIIVEGNAEEKSGAHMKEGKIIIEGNSDGNLGGYMQGGEIIVNGSIKNIHNLGFRKSGGKIYHKDKKIA